MTLLTSIPCECNSDAQPVAPFIPADDRVACLPAFLVVSLQTLHIMYSPQPIDNPTVSESTNAFTALLIDPRLVALGQTPLQGRVDQWYGTSTPLANSKPVRCLDQSSFPCFLCLYTVFVWVCARARKRAWVTR